MRRHRFHSELTCDEVWYRLNTVLRSFPVWGAKRYEISGELTKWGCYLWLRKPGGRGGTRLPMRLWTEDSGTGCEICCCVFPHRRWLLWLLSTIGFLGLDIFLREVENGVSALSAAGMGVYACCWIAAIMCLIFWGVPWCISLRYSGLLMDWVQAYLLSRDLDGILLPVLEHQRGDWTGLLEQVQVKRSPYVFRCDLSPEDVADAVERWAKAAGAGIRLTVKWRGMRLMLSGTIREEETGGKSWTFSDLFLGQLEPEKAGECVLRGTFVPRPGFMIPQVLFLAIWGYMMFQTARNPILLLILLPIAGWDLYKEYKKPSRNRASLVILEFLRTYFEEV